MQNIPFPREAIRNGYALIDPCVAGGMDLLADLPKQFCLPSLLEQSNCMTPALVNVGILATDQQEKLTRFVQANIASNQPQAVSACIDCDIGLTDLLRHLQRFMVNPDAPEGPAMWRYHDPRVFSLAMNTLNAHQRESLIGPIRQWSFAWCGHWWGVQGAGRIPDPLDGHYPAWPSTAQWRQLEHCEAINIALARLKNQLGGLPAGLCLSYQRRFAESIEVANDHFHLYDPEMAAEYALLYARYGEYFKCHEKLILSWDELAKGAITWSGLLDQLDPHDFKLMDAQASRKSFWLGEDV